MIDKNLKVLDLADGVEKLANISSFDVNSTITDSDLMLIEQSTALKKVTIEDLKTEIGTPTGTPDTIAYFDSAGDLASDVLTFVDNSVIAIEKTLRAKTTLQLGFDKDENAFNGVIQLNNENTNVLNIDYSLNSDRELNLSIENTKATLEDGDILVYNETNSTFKVDNISNYVSGGTGNYHVLKVEFSANSDFETVTILPVGSQIDKIKIDRTGGLTNGIDPLTFKINGTTPVVLATQGIEFDNSAGGITYNFLENDIYIILASGEEGTFMAEWAGAGFGTGNGYAYLYYWTPLP